MLRPDGPSGALVLAGRARDLVTPTDGAAVVARNALLSASIDAEGHLRRLGAHPDGAVAAALVDRPVRAGFRTAVARTLPSHRDEGTPLHLLLDEVPVAVLLSGFTAPRPRSRRGAAGRADVCAGWRADGAALRAVANGEPAPLQPSPGAPALESGEDPWSWHTTTPLPPGAMRRRRRLDLIGGADLEVDAMFRDTFVDDDGLERVLHEYAVEATVDPVTSRVVSMTVQPRALPFAECPVASLSAQQALTRPAGSLRDFVDLELWGPSTCTHLNDLLRMLADVPALARLLPPPVDAAPASS